MITIPTLHLSAPLVSSPNDILAYLVRHYLYTPSNIYENFLDNEYTLSKTLAKKEYNPEHLKELVELDLNDYLGKTFNVDNGYILDVNVNIETVNEKYYNLIIDVIVVDRSGKKYSITPNVKINQNEILEINFDNSFNVQ